MSFDVIILTRETGSNDKMPELNNLIDQGFVISTGKWNAGGSNVTMKEFFDSLVLSHWSWINTEMKRSRKTFWKRAKDKVIKKSG